ncbi:MAG TPA: Na+/H+ antiporter [Gaiellaceae bacterium]|nr:Na+/H+ antiporter [Gaiellaceae bacterium]
MTFGSHDELVLLGLLAAVAALMALAPTLRIPYPILLVVGGLALGFIPGVPELTLPPDLVLVGVLPPLLYSSGFFTSLRDVRANAQSITLLATGLVAATMAAVAVVAHEVVGLAWAPAFVLGAVVAPTDPIAATAIARRLGVPRRVVTIVEGESLVNDATALVLYRAAVVAAVAGTFSFGDAALRFLASVAGGIAVGLVVGWLVALVRVRLDNIPAEIAISLLTGYLAYIPATALHVSGVLAAVTVGVYLGWRAPELSTPAMRMQGNAVWETLVFLVNALLFALVGLQLRPILDALSGQSTASLIGYAALVTATVMAVRLAWVYPHTYLARLLLYRLPIREAPWGEATVIGWTGMRGAVSLAAALAVPLSTDTGAPFPSRALIVFLAFCVILGTLGVQGLTLPAVIRMSRLEEDTAPAREEAKARLLAADAALARLEELREEDWVREDTADRMQGLYNFRRNRFVARFDDGDDGGIEQRSLDYQRLRRELLEAERAAVVELRRIGRINDEVMYRVFRDLDLEDSRLEV